MLAPDKIGLTIFVANAEMLAIPSRHSRGIARFEEDASDSGHLFHMS
jgi:hypothetical protein